MATTALVLFQNDLGRESREKSLPGGLLGRLRRHVSSVAGAVPDVDLWIAHRRGGLLTLTSSGRILSFQTSSLPAQLTTVTDSLKSAGYETLIYLATDVAGITRATLNTAVGLAHGMAAVGPDTDGGFYLAAFPASSAPCWTDLSLGATTCFDELTLQLEKKGLQVVALPPACDIDSPAGVVRASRHFLRTGRLEWVAVLSTHHQQAFTTPATTFPDEQSRPRHLVRGPPPS